MRTSLDLCFCLLTLCGVTPVLYGPAVRVVVKEGSDAVLPCFNSTENLTGTIFDWMKDGQKDVFIYDSGSHSNNSFIGQDLQFRGRVSHFQDELQNGNASIKIQNTKMADSGNYSCDFPRLQPRETFNIELVVERPLKDRSGEIPGASPKPHITKLDKTKDGVLLQCEVRGASPKPKVEWQDSSGNILPAEEPQVSERGGRYYVTTVNKTDHYRCVVTQEEISHQIQSETFVQLNKDLSREVNQWRLATILVAVLAAVVLLVGTVVWCIYFHLRKKRSQKMLYDSDDDSTDQQTAEPHSSDVTDSSECLVKFFRKKRVKTDSHPQNIHPPDETEMLMSDEQLQSAAEHQSSDVTDSSCPPDDPESKSPLNNDELTPLNAEDQSSDVTDSIPRDPGDESESRPEPLK